MLDRVLLLNLITTQSTPIKAIIFKASKVKIANHLIILKHFLKTKKNKENKKYYEDSSKKEKPAGNLFKRVELMNLNWTLLLTHNLREMPLNHRDLNNNKDKVIPLDNRCRMVEEVLTRMNNSI